MGLCGPHALGWLPVHPTASVVSKLQSQHPPSSRCRTSSSRQTFHLPVQGNHPANPPSFIPLRTLCLGVPLLSSPSQSFGKGPSTSRPRLPPGLQPEQLAAANKHLQPGCSSDKLDGGELGVLVGFLVLWVELPVPTWICVLPWSLSWVRGLQMLWGPSELGLGSGCGWAMVAVVLGRLQG